MSTTPLKPLLVAPGEARVYDHIGGENMTILLSAQDTNGSFAMFIDEVPPAAGPPMHIHHNEDETFYILEGQLDITIKGETFTAPAGGTAFLPKGIPHTFHNSSEQTARALVVLTPAGLENFFIEIEPLVIQAEPNMAAILTVAAKYGIEVVPH
ncbi:MAG: cupin domain-containing protein [Anaerolineae bacterium]|nr:cupin domain-containing protein [Anaerolineae bacterium]